jgi:hypothetical protein
VSETTSAPAAPAEAPHPLVTASKIFTSAYRVELQLFVFSFVALAAFSSFRFLRQSEAPHFVYQAKGWLDGRLDVDPPNIEDWACVRDVGGVHQRCAGQPLPTDKWYSSFPAFPAVVMLPFVALHGYQFNDTSFGVFVAALAVAFFYSLLRLINEQEGLGRTVRENVVLSLVLGFGTLFTYCAIRGEVWFSAEVMGVLFTCLYARNALKARRPLLAGLFWSMAVLTRTPLFFTGIFFVAEAIAPGALTRREELQAFMKDYRPGLRKLGWFTAGAAPLGLLAAWFNQVRFGSITEFGHRYFFNNRVNQDIDTWGLFHPHYLARNLDAAFLQLPVFGHGPAPVSYSPWGMSLFLTLPLLALAFAPESRPRAGLISVGATVATLIVSALFPATGALGERAAICWLALLGTGAVWLYFSSNEAKPQRLKLPVVLALGACAIPGLFYQNTGYAQFGFRFSLDYTPYVLLLVVIAGWRVLKPLPATLAAINGAFAF